MGTPSQFTGSGEPAHVVETSATPRWILILFVIAFLVRRVSDVRERDRAASAAKSR